MVEREWREASDMRPSRVNLALVLIAAAGLRFWGLGQGTSLLAGRSTRPEIVNRALTMMRNGYAEPASLLRLPETLWYVQLVVYIVRFLIGAFSGAWNSLGHHRPGAVLRCRTCRHRLSFGTATVLLVFQAGMRWGARHALLAAGLLAVMPVHVQSSHYVLTDTPMTFFVTLALVLVARGARARDDRGRSRGQEQRGLPPRPNTMAPLALLMPLLACLMTPRAKDPRRHVRTGGR